MLQKITLSFKLHAALQEKELSMTGRNWGEAIIDGSTLVFNVAGKPALRIPLTDVGQVSRKPSTAR